MMKYLISWGLCLLLPFSKLRENLLGLLATSKIMPVNTEECLQIKV